MSSFSMPQVQQADGVVDHFLLNCAIPDGLFMDQFIRSELNSPWTLT